MSYVYRYPELRSGRLLRRYKRFLADVELEDGSVVTAHSANTGSMLGCSTPGSQVYLSRATNPARRLQYTWESVRVGRVLVGVNTILANRIVAEAIEAGAITELSGYGSLRREVTVAKGTRLDLLLEQPRRAACYVEVKNVTLADGPVARFPDAVTERGTKHLLQLAELARRGCRAVVLFFAPRGDCTAFGPAATIDPVYARTLAQVRRQGVEVLCYQARVRRDGVKMLGPLPAG